MAKQYEKNDSSVVVVIGSGAGGATLANELAQKGIDVVCLEAGPRLTLAGTTSAKGLSSGSAKQLVARPCAGRASPH